MSPWKTILVEDQTLFRQLLTKSIRESEYFEHLGDAGNAEEGYELCSRLRPRLVIMDLELPDENGLDLSLRLLREFPDVRLVALTAKTDAYTVNRVREVGMHAYLEKDLPWTELENAMREVAAGGEHYSDLMKQRLRESARDPKSFHKFLSHREQQILAHVVEGRNSREISERLNISFRTVQNHRYNLMKKLGISDLASLTRFATQSGFWSEKTVPRRADR